jgi:hypothetical protein
MAKEIAFKFINSRKVSFAVLASDLSIGYKDDSGKYTPLFVIPDFLLKKSATKGYYYQGPSKPYMKDGVHQQDDNGYNRYLEFFRLYTEKGAGKEPDKYAPTGAAFEARKYLIGLLVAELNQLGGEAEATPARPAARATRSAATAPRATRPAEAATAIEEEEVAVPGDEEEDPLPF